MVVTGLGFITSIGNSRAEVSASLQTGRSGVEIMPALAEFQTPVKLAGTVKGFEFPDPDPLDWVLPETLKIHRIQMRTMTPNCVYACAAMDEAIEDAALTAEQVSDPMTGVYCASAGSPWLTHLALETILKRGANRCPPATAIAAMPNSLHLNLTARFQIRGASLSFSSACASSAHALGSAYDLIKDGRHNIMFVVGAEDCHPYNILPFGSLRALSVESDPAKAPRAFDRNRDGFVVTGGATTLVLEDAEQAVARGAHIYAEVLGWGQSTDGYDVVAPDPAGHALARAMKSALDQANIGPEAVQYLNAHATATLAGDLAELQAVRNVFPEGQRPWMSSTKSLTGHGLSLAGAMEAGFCCLSIADGFIPVSANIQELDPACDGIPIVTRPIDVRPQIAMSNSCGFGGANVSVLFGQASFGQAT